MFNWFKNRQNSLIPNDINDGMMTNTLINKGIKLGTKLTIPDNVVCFVCYKDKTYCTLDSGTYTIDEKMLSSLISRQVKNGKCKKLKMDLFFVNKKRFIIYTSYSDKIPVSKSIQKLYFNVKTDISISDARAFSNYILSDTATINATQSIDLFRDYIEMFSRKFFLKITLDELSLTNEIKCNFKTKLEKYLNKLGVTLQNSDISITSNKVEKMSLFFNYNHIETKIDKDTNTINEIKVDQTEKKNYTENNSNYCPNCNIRLIQGTRYCHRCGYEI